jgi:hypothetical protein
MQDVLLTPLDEDGKWTNLSGKPPTQWLASCGSFDGKGKTQDEAILELRERIDMATQPTITIKFDANEYGGIIAMYDEAVALNAKPRSWRMSEYVMTKVTAMEAVKSLKTQHNPERKECEYTLTFFDWSLLQGEIARLYMNYGEPEPDSELENRKTGVLSWYAIIMGRMKENSRFNKMIQVIERQEETRRKIEQAERELEEGKRRMWDLQQEACDLTHNARKLGGTTDD